MKEKEQGLFSTVQWVAGISTLVGLTAAVVIFCFQTFETKTHADETRQHVERSVDENKRDETDRLTRIENTVNEIRNMVYNP